MQFNEDTEWHKFIESFDPVIAAIASKFTTDLGLREDCAQEARIALLGVFPENVKGYEEFVNGSLSETAWGQNLSRYVRNVIRNSILSYLDSPKTGNWRIGRTKRVLNRKTGKRVKKHEPPRYSSLDELTDDYGFQIDDEGNVSWPTVEQDGLDVPEIDFEEADGKG